MAQEAGMGKTMRAIGLMSGTSMDGIDVALIETDGEEVVQRGPSATFPYSPEVRRQLAGSHRGGQEPGPTARRGPAAWPRSSGS